MRSSLVENSHTLDQKKTRKWTQNTQKMLPKMDIDMLSININGLELKWI